MSSRSIGMSSRSIGYRPAGGSDYIFRDRSAIVEAIVANKRRLRYTLMLQATLAVVMTLRLSVGLCVLSSVRPPRFLQRFNLPRAMVWEYVWWVSAGFAAMAGLYGTRHNRILYIRMYAFISITTLTTVFYALYILYAPLMEYAETRVYKPIFAGYPVIILWYVFLVLVLQIHGFGVHFARSLLHAWRIRAEERKKM